MSEIATIKGVSIKEGDIVFIKWKPLDEIVKYYTDNRWTASSFLEESQLDYHLTAVMNDGHYKVDSCWGDERANVKKFPQIRSIKDKKKSEWPDEIAIINHNHSDGDTFRFNENLIEEIKVEHDAAETYFSSKFAMSLMKIDGALFINGEIVTKNDSKLIDILENTISDLAIQKMLDSGENN